MDARYIYTPEIALQEQTALFVIDMQNDFVHQEGAFGRAGYDVMKYQRLVPVIQDLTRHARLSGVPVLVAGMSHNEENDGDDAWIQRRRGTGHPDSCRTGTWGAEFFQGLEPHAEDTVIWKHRYSAFVNTPLHGMLAEMGVKTLVFTGINTNTCVESTIRDAHLLGYHVLLVRDATACAYDDAYEPSLRNIARHFGFVVESEQIKTIWKGK